MSDDLTQLRSALTQAHRALAEARQSLTDWEGNPERAKLWLDAGIAAADQALRTAGRPVEIAR